MEKKSKEKKEKKGGRAVMRGGEKQKAEKTIKLLLESQTSPLLRKRISLEFPSLLRLLARKREVETPFISLFSAPNIGKTLSLFLVPPLPEGTKTIPQNKITAEVWRKELAGLSLSIIREVREVIFMLNAGGLKVGFPAVRDGNRIAVEWSEKTVRVERLTLPGVAGAAVLFSFLFSEMGEKEIIGMLKKHKKIYVYGPLLDVGEKIITFPPLLEEEGNLGIVVRGKIIKLFPLRENNKKEEENEEVGWGAIPFRRIRVYSNYFSSLSIRGMYIILRTKTPHSL